MDFLTVPLDSAHNRKDFNCGNELLDNYLRYLASQDIKRKLAACFGKMFLPMQTIIKLFD